MSAAITFRVIRNASIPTRRNIETGVEIVKNNDRSTSRTTRYNVTVPNGTASGVDHVAVGVTFTEARYLAEGKVEMMREQIAEAYDEALVALADEIELPGTGRPVPELSEHARKQFPSVAAMVDARDAAAEAAADLLVAPAGSAHGAPDFREDDEDTADMVAHAQIAEVNRIVESIPAAHRKGRVAEMIKWATNGSARSAFDALKFAEGARDLAEALYPEH